VLFPPLLCSEGSVTSPTTLDQLQHVADHDSREVAGDVDVEEEVVEAVHGGRQRRRRRRAGGHERGHHLLELGVAPPLGVVERQVGGGDVVGVRGRGRHHAPVLRRRRRRRQGRGGGEVQGRGGRGQALGLHREAGAQGLQVGVRVRVVLRRHRWPVDAGMLAVVDDVVQRGVLVGALHLLRRRAPLRVAVRAAVVAPAEFARRR